MPKNARAPEPTQEFLDFGRRLTDLLESCGQDRHGAGAYLAKKYGVAVVTANSWLKGEYRPQTWRARKIAEEHGSTFEALYFGQTPVSAAGTDLTDRERALLDAFRQLTDADQGHLEQIARSLAAAGRLPKSSDSRAA